MPLLLMMMMIMWDKAGRSAFSRIPRGVGPSSGVVNGVLVLGALGYCGYNSVFTGKSMYACY